MLLPPFVPFLCIWRNFVFQLKIEDSNLTGSFNGINNLRGQAEKEFKVEVEAIGRVRHKNLVRLLGYCVEGAYRYQFQLYNLNSNL